MSIKDFQNPPQKQTMVASKNTTHSSLLLSVLQCLFRLQSLQDFASPWDSLVPHSSHRFSTRPVCLYMLVLPHIFLVNRLNYIEDWKQATCLVPNITRTYGAPPFIKKSRRYPSAASNRLFNAQKALQRVKAGPNRSAIDWRLRKLPCCDNIITPLRCFINQRVCLRSL